MSEYVEHDAAGASVGRVGKKGVILDGPVGLECGRELSGVEVAYETWGELNEARDNGVLVCHALTGDAHAAGWYDPADKQPGWWDVMIGPGKGIDTDKYHVICSNVLGGCMGTTGPASANPETGKPYGSAFPVVTIGDMVEVQRRLLDSLGIERLACVVGGSVGGMQALEWSVRFPDRVGAAVSLASTTKHSAQAIAFNEVARQAILADPDFKGGDYYESGVPRHGLAVARMIGHVTYLSDESMRRKFDRKLQDRCDISFDFEADFQVESYLRYQGGKFVDRFDANSFLRMTRAADYFNLEKSWGNDSAVAAFSRAQCPYLVVSYTSDWLYPTYQSRAMVQAMKKSGRDVSFVELEAAWGHDAFLLPNERLTKLLSGFLRRVSGGDADAV